MDKLNLLVGQIERVNEVLDPERLKETELAALYNMVLDYAKGGTVDSSPQSALGSPTKRKGWTRFNTAKPENNGSLVALHDVKDEAGTNYLLATINGSIYKSAAGTAAWGTAIKTGLTADKKTKIASYNNEIFVTNGVDQPFVLKGAGLTTSVNLEIERPAVQGITTTPVGLLSSGNIGVNRWIIVYYTETGEISNISKPLVGIPNGTDNTNVPSGYNYAKMQFSNLPVSSDARVKGRWIFRTESGGTTYYFHSAIDNVVTTWEDNVEDANLDTTRTIDFVNVPTLGKCLATHRDRLWFANGKKQLKNNEMPPAHSSQWTTQDHEVTEMPASAMQLEIVSSSAEDDPDKGGGVIGTGVHQVRLAYQDGSLVSKEEIITLNGTSVVTTVATDIYRISGLTAIVMGTSSAAVGSIVLRHLSNSPEYARIWAGDTMWRGDPPKLIVSTHTGSAIADGTYRWAVAFKNARGQYSELSSYLEYTVDKNITGHTAGRAKIELTAIPRPKNGAASTGHEVVTAMLYRTKANTTTPYYYVKDINTTAGVFTYSIVTDTTPDASLTVEYPDSDDATTNYNSLETFGSHVFYSELFKPSQFNELNIIPVFPEDGDSINAIFDDTDGLLIFKEFSICKIYTQGAPENWTAIKLIDNIGASNDLVVRYGGKYYFIYQSQLFRYPDVIDPALPLSAIFKKSFENISSFVDMTALPNGWIVIAAVVSGTYYIYVFDSKINSFYKFSITECTCLAVKKYGTSAGTLLVGDQRYVVKYDAGGISSAGATQDNEAGTPEDINTTMITRTFNVPDGIAKARLRHIYLNYYKEASSAIVLFIINPDNGEQKQVSYTTESGWVTKKIDTDTMIGTLQRFRKIKVSLGGAGLIKFGNMRISARPIKEGYAVGY